MASKYTESMKHLMHFFVNSLIFVRKKVLASVMVFKVIMLKIGILKMGFGGAREVC